MPPNVVAPHPQDPLRLKAEFRLKGGTAPRSRGGATGVEALTALHTLASTPESAADALKMLHELQVHQVELDLQHEQIEQERLEVSERLAHYSELYEHAPVAYFSVSHDGRIAEANHAGARLCGVEREALHGRPIDSLVTQDSQSAVQGLLDRLRTGSSGTACTVQCGSAARRIHVTGSAAPRGNTFLLAFVDTTGGGEHDPQ